MEIKYKICDKVFYLNTAERKIVSAEIKGVRVIPTGISKDAKGRNKLEGSAVLYETFEGPVLAEQECFASEKECAETFRKVFA